MSEWAHGALASDPCPLAWSPVRTTSAPPHGRLLLAAVLRQRLQGWLAGGRPWGEEQGEEGGSAVVICLVIYGTSRAHVSQKRSYHHVFSFRLRYVTVIR